jgi:hypothetical protein
MATQVATAGGTDVSFSNTPQAKDDVFTESNDLYALNYVFKYNVMANDLGGAAKSLYSVDDGVSDFTATKKPAPADLLDSDKDHVFEATAVGAEIQVTDDGQLGVKMTQTFLNFLATINEGTYTTVNFTYAIQLGNGTLSWATAAISFEGTKVLPPSDNAPGTAASAFSHGHWMTQGFGESEGFDAGVADLSFDDFFHLDDPGERVWTDWDGTKTDPDKGPGVPINPTLPELSFEQAIAFGNGAGNIGDTTTPSVPGPFEDLVREAATAVLNYFDTAGADAGHNSFVEWYIYQRAHYDDTHAGAPQAVITEANVLADLQSQVDMTLTGVSGAYSVEDLTALLHLTHH